MKRVVVYLLAVVLLMSLFSACGSNSTDPQQETMGTTTTSDKEAVFEKPDNYVSVVLVTINPQFKLYLDATGDVLAVEPVNDDARQVAAKMTAKTGGVETVVDSLIAVANEDGFVKQDVTVNIEVAEVRSEAVDTATVLETVKNTVEAQMQQLNVQAEIKTSVAESVQIDTTVNEITTTRLADKTTTTTDIPTTEKTVKATASQTTVPTTAVTKVPTTTEVLTTTKAPTTTKTPNYTAVKQKNGYWKAMYLNGDTLQIVTLTFAGELSVGLGLGDPLNKLPEEVREDMKPDCDIFQGEYYYVGRGDGDEIASVDEYGATVTVKDLSGNTLTLTRISETELQVVTALSAFSVLETLPKDVVFTYHTPED